MCVCCVCVCVHTHVYVCSHLLMVKVDRQNACFCVLQICFKPKRVNSWNECFDEVEGGARYRGILGHMTSGCMRKGDTVQWLLQQTSTKGSNRELGEQND